jgi:hypothetical protein
MRSLRKYIKQLVREVIHDRQSDVLYERRVINDVYQTIVRAIATVGPRSHQELLAIVLHKFPYMSDEAIDDFIDGLEETGDIVYDPRLQKYK